MMENIQYAKDELDFVWPSHSDFLIDSIYESYNKNCFTDVTLVCKDGTESVSIKAHKIILAACSPALASLFSENIDNHPLEFEGIRYEDLKYMLDFMYAGQTVVPKHREEAFKSIAKCFKVELLSPKSEDQKYSEELAEYESSKNDHKEDLDKYENSTIVDFDENSLNLIQITVEDLYKIEKEEMKKKKFHKSDTEIDFYENLNSVNSGENSSNVIPISIEDLFKMEQEAIKKKAFNKTKKETLEMKEKFEKNNILFQNPGDPVAYIQKKVMKKLPVNLKQKKLFPCKKCGFHLQSIKDYADHVSLCKTPTTAQSFSFVRSFVKSQSCAGCKEYFEEPLKLEQHMNHCSRLLKKKNKSKQ